MNFRVYITVILLSLSTLPFHSLEAQKYYLICGTYTSTGKSKGIYVYSFDAANANTRLLSTALTDNPSYLALDRKGVHLYAVNEVGGGHGAVSGFIFDRKRASLRLINRQPTQGDDPCFIALDSTNRWVATANYTGGSVTMFPLTASGTVDSAAQLIEHHGHGPNTQRQAKAHVHSTVFSPDQQALAVADLGSDEVKLYPFHSTEKTPLDTASFTVHTAPGSGPRHLLFARRLPILYSIEELSGNVTAYRYANGRLDSLQTISAFPDGFTGERGSAAIRLSPDEKFLYTSNRGTANTLSVFRVDSSSGRLQLAGIQPTGGIHPRDFTIDPTGKFLLTGNMLSDNIVIFRRNALTGLLKDTGKRIRIPRPTRLIFTSMP